VSDKLLAAHKPVAMEGAMFSEDFRKRLALGEHTRWATDLTQDHLQALLWMVGEFFYRCSPLLALLEDYSEEIGSKPNLARAKDAMTALLGIEADEPKGQAIFSQEFRRELELGKHTQWARDLSDAEVEVLLRVVGEFAEHAQPFLEWLDQHAAEAPDSYQFIRAHHGLEATARIVAGERYDVEEATRRVCERVASRYDRSQG
jgi:hypothetical protein